MPRPSAIALLLLLLFVAPAFSQDACGLQVTSYANYTVWRNDDILIFTSGMTIDADGSPRAYHPDNVSGLDDLRNAGSPGGWVALATIDGEPILQGPHDPAPSFFVSMTSLEDPSYPGTSPAHFVNAEEVPYIALPPDLDGPELGDIAFVVNTRHEKSSAAIFADQSPSGRLGEGSIALARQLGINADARYGGIDHGLIFVVFLDSGERSPLPVRDINARARSLHNQHKLNEILQCVADSTD
jgi:hypothetical protein